MARRYGKVTVTGWINEGWRTLHTSEKAPNYWSYPGNAVVEFLPEQPVVFKDGDALREQCNGHVWSRSNGHWMSTLSNHVFRDPEMELFLRSGGWVRLVAEGATDAG